MGEGIDGLVYSVGDEWGPNGIHGAYTTRVWPWGVHLERRALGQLAEWDVEVAPAWRALVTEALAASPFPEGEATFPAGASLRTLLLEGQSASVEWRAAFDDPAWVPLFGLLDAVAWLVCPEQMVGPKPETLDPAWVVSSAPSDA